MLSMLEEGKREILFEEGKNILRFGWAQCNKSRQGIRNYRSEDEPITELIRLDLQTSTRQGMDAKQTR